MSQFIPLYVPTVSDLVLDLIKCIKEGNKTEKRAKRLLWLAVNCTNEMTTEVLCDCMYYAMHASNYKVEDPVLSNDDIFNEINIIKETALITDRSEIKVDETLELTNHRLVKTMIEGQLTNKLNNDSTVADSIRPLIRTVYDVIYTVNKELFNRGDAKLLLKGGAAAVLCLEKLLGDERSKEIREIFGGGDMDFEITLNPSIEDFEITRTLIATLIKFTFDLVLYGDSLTLLYPIYGKMCSMGSISVCGKVIEIVPTKGQGFEKRGNSIEYSKDSNYLVTTLNNIKADGKDFILARVKACTNLGKAEVCDISISGDRFNQIDTYQVLQF